MLIWAQTIEFLDLDLLILVEMLSATLSEWFGGTCTLSLIPFRLDNFDMNHVLCQVFVFEFAKLAKESITGP